MVCAIHGTETRKHVEGKKRRPPFRRHETETVRPHKAAGSTVPSGAEKSGPGCQAEGRTEGPAAGSYLPNLSLPARTLAILIAAISICGSLVTLVLGVRDGKWLLVLLAPFGVWYGIAWVRVAQEGWFLAGGCG